MLSFLNEYMIKKRFGVDILRTLHEHVKDHIHHHTYKQLRLTNTSYRITRLPPIEAEHWVTDALMEVMLVMVIHLLMLYLLIPVTKELELM